MNINKIHNENSGVSDVLGVILLMGITIILFSGFIALISTNLNLNEENSNYDMASWLENGVASDKIHISYTNGPNLLVEDIQVVLQINFNLTTIEFEDGFDGDVFGVGDEWIYTIPNLANGTEIYIQVLYNSMDNPIHQATVPVSALDSDFVVQTILSVPESLELRADSTFVVKAYIKGQDGLIPENLAVSAEINNLSLINITLTFSVGESAYISEAISLPNSARIGLNVINVSALGGGYNATNSGYVRLIPNPNNSPPEITGASLVPATVSIGSSILYNDEFNILTDNWSGPAAWNITNVSGENMLYNPGAFSQIITGSTNWENYTITVKTKPSNRTGIVFRYIDDENFWQFISESNELRIRGKIDNVWTNASGSSTTSFSINTSNYYYFKALIVSNRIRGKVWDISASEPLTWNLDVYDSRLTIGSVGLAGENTPYFDNFSVEMYNNSNTNLTVSATITDPNGLDDISIVAAEIKNTSISAELNDDGSSPDQTSGDGIFTGSLNISDIYIGNYTVNITATDRSSYNDYYNLSLRIRNNLPPELTAPIITPSNLSNSILLGNIIELDNFTDEDLNDYYYQIGIMGNESHWVVGNNSGNLMLKHLSACSYSQILTGLTTESDYTIRVKVKPGYRTAIVFRFQDELNFWRLIAQNGNLILRGLVDGSWEDATGDSNISCSVDTSQYYWMLVNVSGSSFSGKMWQTTLPEPTGWMVTATENRLAYGSVGLGADQEAYFDEFIAYNHSLNTLPSIDLGVNVTDADGAADISLVFATNSELGLNVTMADDGNGNDAQANDGIYSASVIVYPSCENGNYTMVFQAVDHYNNLNSTNKQFTIYFTHFTENILVYWKLNDGTGDQATDSSGNNNNGTITGASWGNGVNGSGLTFDGIDDYVIKNPIDSFATTKITAMFWMKSSDITNSGTPISYASTNSFDDFVIYDYQSFKIYRGSNLVSTGIGANDGEWHQITVTWQSSNGAILLYKDGVSVYSGTLALGTSIATGGSLVIGQEQDNIGNDFNPTQAFLGSIDEVIIHSRILSAEEIYSYYNSTKPADITRINALWHFDENLGSTAYDSIGDNDAAIYGPSWTLGVNGSALNFDGSNDYVIKNPVVGFPNNEITVTFWMKSSDTTKNGTPFSYAVSNSDDEFLIYDYQSFSIYRGSGTVNTGVGATDGEWHYIAVTWKGSDGETIFYKDGAPVYSGTLAADTSITAGGSIVIGQDQDNVGNDFNVNQAFLGMLDEVTVYNRVLTPEEILTAYNSLSEAKLAQWLLDENLGSTAYDSLGNNNGTIVGANWTAGINGSALDFNGSDDYVNCTNSVSPISCFTVIAWVKPESIAADRQIVSKGNDGANTQWELKTTTADGKVSFQKWDGSAVGVESSQSLSIETWTYIVGTFNDTTWKLYWNGILDNSNIASGPVANSRNLYIGALDNNGIPSQFWHGMIDEVTIYNRVLTAAEIQVFYNTTLAGRIAQWHLNENASNTANDYINGNDGTISNSNWTTGMNRSALRFIAEQDYVQVTDDNSLDLIDAISIEAWLWSMGDYTGPYGEIKEQIIDTLEFDTLNCLDPEAILITDELIAIVYNGDGGGFIATLTVDGNGIISNPVIDLLEFDLTVGKDPEIIHVYDNIYAIAYGGVGDDGFVLTLEINTTTGELGPIIDSLEYNTLQGLEPDIIQIHDDVYAIAHSGDGSDGYIKTIKIASDGNINDSIIDTLEFNTVQGSKPEIININGSLCAVVYYSKLDVGLIDTIQINDLGEISDTVLDSFEHDSDKAINPSIVHVSGDIYAIAYCGAGENGFIKTIYIYGDGAIGPEIDILEYDTTRGAEPDLIHLTGVTYAVAYRGAGDNGFLRTIEIDTNGNIIKVIDTLNFDINKGYQPNIINIYNDLYVIAYSGFGTDGFFSSIGINTIGKFGGISKEQAYAINTNSTTAFAIINNQTISCSITPGFKHLVLTYDKNAASYQMKLYVNGTLGVQYNLTENINSNSNALYFGQYFNGTIDEVTIYNRILTAEEIQESYSRMSSSRRGRAAIPSNNYISTVKRSGLRSSNEREPKDVNVTLIEVHQQTTVYVNISSTITLEVDINAKIDSDFGYIRFFIEHNEQIVGSDEVSLGNGTFSDIVDLLLEFVPNSQEPEFRILAKLYINGIEQNELLNTTITLNVMPGPLPRIISIEIFPQVPKPYNKYTIITMLSNNGEYLATGSVVIVITTPSDEYIEEYAVDLQPKKTTEIHSESYINDLGRYDISVRYVWIKYSKELPSSNLSFFVEQPKPPEIKVQIDASERGICREPVDIEVNVSCVSDYVFLANFVLYIDNIVISQGSLELENGFGKHALPFLISIGYHNITAAIIISWFGSELKAVVNKSIEILPEPFAESLSLNVSNDNTHLNSIISVDCDRRISVAISIIDGFESLYNGEIDIDLSYLFSWPLDLSPGVHYLNITISTVGYKTKLFVSQEIEITIQEQYYSSKLNIIFNNEYFIECNGQLNIFGNIKYDGKNLSSDAKVTINFLEESYQTSTSGDFEIILNPITKPGNYSGELSVIYNNITKTENFWTTITSEHSGDNSNNKATPEILRWAAGGAIVIILFFLFALILKNKYKPPTRKWGTASKWIQIRAQKDASETDEVEKKEVVRKVEARQNIKDQGTEQK